MIKKPFIIADIGSNWRRDENADVNLKYACWSISLAKKAGCDAVKFQLFTHEELYGEPGDNTYALPGKWLSILAENAANHQIEFMCTAFSADGVRAVDPFVKRHKVASAEFLHLGIRDAIKKTEKPVIMSWGGGDFREGIGFWENGLTLLECVSVYPAAPSQYNLKAMGNWLAWCSSIGVSDHTLSPAVALAAIGFGATVFEKHFDPFPDLPRTPDSSVSASPGELMEYCALIQQGFSAIGDGIKRPMESEKEFLKIRRKTGENTFRGKP